MKKPQEILELEKLFNTKFEKVKIEAIIDIGFEKTAQYSQDQEGNIIGLRIEEFELEEIPQSISKFEKLTHLNFSSNSISDISPIASLANLTEIYFSRNSISDISPIASLANLTRIYFSRNSISDISPIASLANLTWINFSSNSISNISPIASLANLTRINFSRNSISDISPIASLANLTRINFSRNSISDIPLIVFQNLEEFDNWENTLAGNEIQNPPQDIISQGRTAILNYFEKIEEEGKKYLFECKVLILGEGGTGKTSFAIKVKDEHAELPQDKDTTLGVDITKWEFPISHQEQNKKMYVNLWDFGGQKHYRGTHQLFFTSKSFYVLLDDTREEKTDFSYWLNTVEQLAGEQSKVLIFTNKKHGHTPSIDKNGLKGRFGEIIHGFETLDLKDDKDKIIQFRQDLQHLLPKMEGVGDAVPSSWVKIREELFAINENYISFDEYRHICKRHKSDITRKDMNFMSDYFNRIGVFTHYHDDKFLSQRVFLNSDWLFKLVYEVLNHKIVSEDKKGKITEADLQKIWCHGDEDLSEYLKPLMQRFGMMYEVEDEQKYIVPQHLSEEQPYTQWEHENQGEILQFAYEFDKYMPHGIMPRLIVALQDCIKNHELVWQKGVNIEYQNSHAEIVKTYEKTNKYLIRIFGKNRKELLGIINREFDKILKPFKGLEYEKLVPCICGECKGNAKPYFFKHSSLEKRKEKGVQKAQCDTSYEQVDVIKLLGGVNLDKNKMKNNMEESEKIKVFVSYSSDDRDLRQTISDKLRTHLQSNKYQYEAWTDVAITVNDDWNTEIQTALGTSNIGILLVSPAFLGSKYAMGKEFQIMLEKRKNEGYIIVPVLLRNCRFFNNEDLAAMQFFKTYRSEYGVKNHNEKNKLMPFDKLLQLDDPYDTYLNEYLEKLAIQIDDAVEKQRRK